MRSDDTQSLRWPVVVLPAYEDTVELRLKRALDVTVAGLLLVLTLPALVLARLVIRLTSRGRALISQPRIGHCCREFEMYKLRTMVRDADKQEADLADRDDGIFFKLDDDPRITRIGRLLRRFSIDELPQLLNVIRGEMSLVGPRPLLRSDFRKFPRGEQLERFSMRPGLTGLWQVSGRSVLSDEERIALDLEYVRQWSLWLDLKILTRTIPAVLSGRGAT